MRHDEEHDGNADACAFCRERLPDYAAGHLQGDERLSIEQHLRTCSLCSAELREWEAITQVVRTTNGASHPQRGFADTWSELRAQLSSVAITLDRSHYGRVLMDNSTSSHADQPGMDSDVSLRPAILVDEPTSKRGRLGARARGFAAAVAMVATVAALIAVLITLAPGHRPGTSAGVGGTDTERGRWVDLTALDYNAVEGANSLPAIAPTNPLVVYETHAGGSKPFDSHPAVSTMRRTDDGGKTWHTLPLPVAGDHVEALGVAVSPLNAYTVFLDVFDFHGGDCPADRAQTSEGGPGTAVCWLQYTSVDAGQHWTATVLPLAGTLSADTSADGVPAIYKGSLHALGDKLYAGFGCAGPAGSCTRLVTSSDGGLTWTFADAAIVSAGGGTCDYAPSPDGATLFVVTSAKSCWLNEQGPLTLWRSSDAGAHWTQAGTLPTPNIRGMLITQSKADDKQLLYAMLPRTTNMQTVKGSNVYPKVPVWSSDIADLKVSADGGTTWESAPNAGIPADLKPVNQYGTMNMLGTLSDGSVVMEFIAKSASDDFAGATLFAWKRGDSAWRQIAPPYKYEFGSMIAVPGKGTGQQDMLYLVVVNRNYTAKDNTFIFLRYES